MKQKLSLLLALLMVLSTLAFAGVAEGTALTPAVTAEELVGMEMDASAFTLATSGAKVTSAVIKMDANVGKYVQVYGEIYPVDPAAFNIEFSIVLPAEWNGKAIQFGGGGYSGSIPNLIGVTSFGSTSPFQQGYVCFGDDSGHQSDSANDATFALNDESLMNWGHEHILKCYDAMQAIVNAYYGNAPEYVYWNGNSTGGREALSCATRYGKYYDGIICNNPTANYIGLRLWGAVISSNVYASYDEQNYPHSDGFIPEDTVKAISADAIARYDMLDGIEDGIVSNMWAARAQKNDFLAEIKTKYSLNDAQMKTLDIYENGYKLNFELANGFTTYGGYAALEGGVMDLGPDEVPRDPLDTAYNVHHGDRADQNFRYLVARDPEFSILKDVEDWTDLQGDILERTLWVSNNIDANSANFDEFIAHNGKLILTSGWYDTSVAPFQVLAMYNTYVEKYGKDTVDSFCKYYIVPSVTHGGGVTWDNLGTLDTWVTTGTYPENVTGLLKATGAEIPMPQYPGWVKYVEGDPMQASSYEVSFEIPENYNFD